MKHLVITLGLALALAALFTPESAFAGVSKTVRFAAGSSGTVIDGNVIRGERDRYFLSAGGGQRMNVRIRSTERNAVFDVYSPSGATLATEATNWSGVLPKSGSYTIVVGGTRGNATYSLSITIR